VQVVAVSLDEHAGGQLDGERQDNRADDFPLHFGRHVGTAASVPPVINGDVWTAQSVGHPDRSEGTVLEQ